MKDCTKCEKHLYSSNNCANYITIGRPLKNVGTWRGVFEPSTITLGLERKRVCVGYAICAISTIKGVCNSLDMVIHERRTTNEGHYCK